MAIFLLVSAELNVKRNDLRIAAIAKEIGAIVVTRNRRDFGHGSKTPIPILS